MSMIKNRIEKNLKKIKTSISKNNLEAYRIYDRDIPEYPYIIDIYKNQCLIHDKTDPIKDKDKNYLPELLQAIKELFQINDDLIHIKKRARQEGTQQYEKLNSSGIRFIVRENQAQFYVNLNDYLDTGLFLDHRPIRQIIYKEAAEKNFLNLFCYTGSVSVFAALGGARTTSVDMSQTYLNWAMDNFNLNQIDLGSHKFIRSDVLEWLNEHRYQAKYDLIFLDPPTFSNSKKMEDYFEVEKDQDFIVQCCMQMLRPGGVLYFSNNKRKFKLSQELISNYQIKDISEKTIPIDFHDMKIHNCYKITHLTE